MRLLFCGWCLVCTPVRPRKAYVERVSFVDATCMQRRHVTWPLSTVANRRYALHVTDSVQIGVRVLSAFPANFTALRLKNLHLVPLVLCMCVVYIGFLCCWAFRQNFARFGHFFVNSLLSWHSAFGTGNKRSCTSANALANALLHNKRKKTIHIYTQCQT